jgi:hypothetical protein
MRTQVLTKLKEYTELLDRPEKKTYHMWCNELVLAALMNKNILVNMIMKMQCSV